MKSHPPPEKLLVIGSSTDMKVVFLRNYLCTPTYMHILATFSGLGGFIKTKDMELGENSGQVGKKLEEWESGMDLIKVHYLHV